MAARRRCSAASARCTRTGSGSSRGPPPHRPRPPSSVRPRPREAVPDGVGALVAAGGRVHAVDPGRRTLEETFLDLIRRTDLDAVAHAEAAGGAPARELAS